MLRRRFRSHCSAGLVLLAVGAIAPAAKAAWATRDINGVDTRVYTPASLSPVGDGRALLVLLHGCGQTADDLKDYGNLEPAADEFGVAIAVPNVPGGGLYMGCWGYYGPAHTRTSGHEGDMIELTEALRDDPALLVDPAQMYIVGFSAGAGEAITLGCLAPDLFAGVGIAAGPAVGTTGDFIATVGDTTAESAATLCESLAGPHAIDLSTQLAVDITDTQDVFVAQAYAQINADMFDRLYTGGTMDSSTLDVTALPGVVPLGVGSIYSDADGPRVAWMTTVGRGHAWPAGSGSGAGTLAYISGNGVNYSAYLAEFFSTQSRRAGTDWTPSVAEDPDPTGDSGDGDGSSGGGSGSSGGEGSSGGAGVGDDGLGGSSGGDSSAGADEDAYLEPTGCQCRATSRPGRPGAWSLLALLVAWRRRRPASQW
jgi:poly(3-hydroxybutyrate) depolymerase